MNDLDTCKRQNSQRAKVYSREDLENIYMRAPDTLIDIILDLQEKNVVLLKRSEELEQRLRKNSRNSSKPPSSDGPGKPAPKSQRKKSGKKTGGQKGHTGHFLKKSENPDSVVTLKVCRCSCSADLSDQPAIGHDCRQVFELPQPKLEVTEYKSELKICPDCGSPVKAPFPQGVNAPVQYGPGFRSLLVYLQNQQLLPVNRISQIMADLFNAPVSEAAILDASRRSYENLASFEEALKKTLCGVPVLHVDESGARTANKLHWLHTAGTDAFTFYGIHEKRGAEAMNHFNILPNFNGRIIHDFWKSYFTFNCTHGLCNAHILRELIFLHEQENQIWAAEMHDLLLETRHFVNSQSGQLTEEQKAPWLVRYREIIARGWQANPLKQKPFKTRGRPKRSKAQNLLLRLGDYEDSVLAFLHDRQVPFTNNLAEQDIRMLKVRLKVSGCFRTVKGAKQFARIRSYLSTLRKQGQNILDNISKALIGTPFLPDSHSL